MSTFLKYLSLFGMAMLPVIELRGSVPWGVAQDLNYGLVLLVSILGNMVPVPFIILFIRRIFDWMKKKSARLAKIAEKMDAGAVYSGGDSPARYRRMDGSTGRIHIRSQDEKCPARHFLGRGGSGIDHDLSQLRCGYADLTPNLSAIPIKTFRKSLDNPDVIWYNITVIGVWLSPVECLVRDQEAAGSNPVTPMKESL